MKTQYKLLLRLLALMVSAALAAFSTLAQPGAIKGRITDKENILLNLDVLPVGTYLVLFEHDGEWVRGKFVKVQ